MSVEVLSLSHSHSSTRAPTAAALSTTSPTLAGSMKHPGGSERRLQLESQALDVLRVLGGPLEYTVVHSPAVRLRVAPSTSARAVCRLLQGAVVRGVPAGGWLRLQNKEVWSASADGFPTFATGTGWALINGSHLGKGDLLVPTWAKLSVAATFLEALEVSWPGIPAEVATYCVQWRPSVPRLSEEDEGRGEVAASSMRGTGGHAVCRTPRTLLHGLPAGAPLQIRVVARVSSPTLGLDDVGLVGFWTEVRTDLPSQKALEHLEGGAQFADPFSLLRGACHRSVCCGFVAVEDFNVPNFDRCRRCGSSYKVHDAVRPEEATFPAELAGPAAASRPRPPSRPPPSRQPPLTRREPVHPPSARQELPPPQETMAPAAPPLLLPPPQQQPLDPPGQEDLVPEQERAEPAELAPAEPLAERSQGEAQEAEATLTQSWEEPCEVLSEASEASEASPSECSSVSVEDAPEGPGRGKRKRERAGEPEDEQSRWEVLLSAEVVEPECSEVTSDSGVSSEAEGWSKADVEAWQHEWLEVVRRT